MEHLSEQPRNEAEVLAQTQELWNELMTGPHRAEAYNEMADFGQHLKKKYQGKDGSLSVTDYTLYHLLGGSGLMPGHTPKAFDFPGDDSVEAFLKALKVELQGK